MPDRMILLERELAGGTHFVQYGRDTWAGQPPISRLAWNTRQSTWSHRSGVPEPSPSTGGQARDYILEPPLGVDTGHPFRTTKQTLWLSHPSVHITGPRTEYYLRGALVPLDDRAYIFPKVKAATSDEIGSHGATAIANTAPTRPQSGLATLILESIAGIPMMVGKSLIKAKSVRNKLNETGGEYLNVQFGWVPMVSELKALVTTLRDTSRILTQFERDSGRGVRRRFEFPWESSHELMPLAGAGYGGYNQLVSSPGTSTLEVLRREKWAFSGRFVYSVAIPNDLFGTLKAFEQKANHLLGARITPDVLWQLAPWSWLIDWFGTIGDSVSAMTFLTEDGLVMQYGYLMRTIEVQHVIRTTGIKPANGSNFPSSTQIKLRVEQKERHRASPFGFGLNWADMGPYQLSILAALGVSRL